MGASGLGGDRSSGAPQPIPRTGLAHWRWRSVVGALQACRGIQLIHAVRIVAELGDLSRFSHPRQLMSYLGLISSEDSSGERRRQGAITKAGDSSAQRALVDIAWKAQVRLCARFRRLTARG